MAANTKVQGIVPDTAIVAERTKSQVASSRWQALRKELSVGLELECFLPDLGALAPDLLTPVETKASLFRLVADRLTALLRRAHGGTGAAEEAAAIGGGCHCRADARRVSADERDWGSLWTVTDDGSIRPEQSCVGVNPFPIELVSKRMRFEDVDVAFFCDVVHTLSAPPISGKANESTGLHVHVGKYPGFFNVQEVVCIIKAYLRYEPVINRLLPLSRQRNQFCVDLREVLAKLGGMGHPATEEALIGHVDRAADKVASLSEEQRAAFLTGVSGWAARGRLLPALLGTGLVWSCRAQLALSAGPAVAEGGGLAPERWVPPGMVLREIARAGEVLWRAPSSEDLLVAFAAEQDAPPNPVDALECLEDDEQVLCDFALPPEVSPEGLELWLLRGALGLAGRQEDRYCKLNLTRMHMPGGRATLEFRQFPGGNFDRALTIWGWVRFLGQFISQSVALPSGLPSPSGPPADEQELKAFMQLSSDTLLLAWYRDTILQQKGPEAELAEMRARWAELLAGWRAAARESEGGSVLTACGPWRKVFWAAARMSKVLPPEDELWAEFQAGQHMVEGFLQRLYRALEQMLHKYTTQLRAMEEVSRCTTLATVVVVAVAGGGVQRARSDIRLLQASIVETFGFSKCDRAMLERIQTQGALASELLLDHIRNLLDLCERTASALLAEDLAPDGGPAKRVARALPGPGPGSGDEVSLERTESRAVAPATGRRLKRLPGGDAPETEKSLLRRLYQELCGLLAPRADEVQGLWQGLRKRGWAPERVELLNLCLSRGIVSFREAPDQALGLE